MTSEEIKKLSSLGPKVFHFFVVIAVMIFAGRRKNATIKKALLIASLVVTLAYSARANLVEFGDVEQIIIATYNLRAHNDLFASTNNGSDGVIEAKNGDQVQYKLYHSVNVLLTPSGEWDQDSRKSGGCKRRKASKSELGENAGGNTSHR